MSNSDTPSKVGSSEGLGPLPEPDMSHRKAPDDCNEETSYSAEAMNAERSRCFELGMAHEREQWEYAVRYALSHWENGMRGLQELMNRA